MEHGIASFLGRGWSFPPHFDERTKLLVTAADEDDIRQSLHILFHTEPGERIMQPEYGCALRQFLFEHPSLSTITHMQDVIAKAILRFEPRIVVEAVLVDTQQLNDALLFIHVDYTIRTVNSRHNVVFPFLREATLLGGKI
ncbi:GPW/gp25 family protein [Hymenobacter chitinivorans]|uniref:IraD/Gp25-like domain-containing protein n=1 Tax=Hymenobacter chitinivorans DSM 11115 TaxID=1121954 RepID=A0A2M9BSA9_9BACT|nr:GPW/gp25 family protein [Hymenobacter chitinivorans]PJJ60782.1 hypothetical protein CLV45_2215 [Hymenobacter chitinivorans DSM 11115]